MLERKWQEWRLACRTHLLISINQPWRQGSHYPPFTEETKAQRGGVSSCSKSDSKALR